MIDPEVAEAINSAVRSGAISLEGANLICDALELGADSEHWDCCPGRVCYCGEDPIADSWDDYTDPYEARGLSRRDFL